jgi:hypothetical protein
MLLLLPVCLLVHKKSKVNNETLMLLCFYYIVLLINIVLLIAGITWTRWGSWNSKPWSHPRTDLLASSFEVQVWVLLEEEVTEWTVIFEFFGLFVLLHCFSFSYSLNLLIYFICLPFKILVSGFCSLSTFLCVIGWLIVSHCSVFFSVQIHLEGFCIAAIRLIHWVNFCQLYALFIC